MLLLVVYKILFLNLYQVPANMLPLHPKGILAEKYTITCTYPALTIITK